jgi:prepilin peptidase CpaA
MIDPFPAYIVCAILIAAAAFDLEKHKIPNYINYYGMLAAITFHSWNNGYAGLAFSLQGIGVGIALLIIPYMMGGMGAGDAKLMGVVGGFLGMKAVFLAFLVSALIGGLYAVIVIIVHRVRHQDWLISFNPAILLSIGLGKKMPLLHCEFEKGKSKPRLCYGVAIAIGTISYVVWNIIQGYPI